MGCGEHPKQPEEDKTSRRPVANPARLEDDRSVDEHKRGEELPGPFDPPAAAQVALGGKPPPTDVHKPTEREEIAHKNPLAELESHRLLNAGCRRIEGVAMAPLVNDSESEGDVREKGETPERPRGSAELPVAFPSAREEKGYGKKVAE